MANCGNWECGVPLHYSIDSKQKNPYFPCCSPKCYEAFKAREKRDREELEARWHAEKARKKEEQKQESAKIQAEWERSPEGQKVKRRVEEERRKEKEEKSFAAGFNFFWFVITGIACLVGWNIAGWLGVIGGILTSFASFLLIVIWVHAEGFGFFWFGLIAIACFVGWNIAGWLGVTIGFTLAVLVSFRLLVSK